jgi:hypothetical protein
MQSIDNVSNERMMQGLKAVYHVAVNITVNS